MLAGWQSFAHSSASAELPGDLLSPLPAQLPPPSYPIQLLQGCAATYELELVSCAGLQPQLQLLRWRLLRKQKVKGFSELCFA